MTDDELDRRVRASILAEQIDTDPLARSIRARIGSPRAPRWAAVAASLALVMAGALAYAIFFRPHTPPLCIAAAQDHEREIVKGEPRRWLADLSSIQSLAQKQGVPASAITALGTTGYRLERARLCFLDKQIYLHLLYAKDGGEFSVYLRRRSGEPIGDSVHQANVGPDNLAYFESHGLTAVFVSHHSGAAADVLAFANAGLRSLTVVAL
jgi:hypothetical protein